MTQYSFGVVTTSTAVTTTAMSPSGTPVFIVTRQFGALISEPSVPVATSGTSAQVNLVAFTAALPDA